jgi:hypothetical protein
MRRVVKGLLISWQCSSSGSLSWSHDWGMLFTEYGAVFNREDLGKFAATVWNNTSGDVLTASRRSLPLGTPVELEMIFEVGP